MLFTAYKQLRDDYEARMFGVLASRVARHCGVSLGLIASREDAQSLAASGFCYDELLPADLRGTQGADIKLDAIARFLPEGHALVDNDVFFTRYPDIDYAAAWCLNYEPLRLYRAYEKEEHAIVERCLPAGENTINAGLLYMPPPLFRDYAMRALELAQHIRCIGHVYEQMFFARFAQDAGLKLRAVYPHSVHSQPEVEAMWRESGIRHPFCYKTSLLEAQRAIDIAMLHADPDETRRLLKSYWPGFSEMAYRRLFRPL
jgi:hypothetical protein